MLRGELRGVEPSLSRKRENKHTLEVSYLRLLSAMGTVSFQRCASPRELPLSSLHTQPAFSAPGFASGGVGFTFGG